MFRQDRPAAARHAVAPVAAAPLGDAVRPGQRHQRAYAQFRISIPNPDDLPDLFRRCTDAVARRSAQLLEPRSDIATGAAAQAVALGQQGREFGGERTCRP